MQADPPIPADGRCARDGCRKKRGRIAVKHDDPFCSSPCAKRWHELDFGLDADERDTDEGRRRQAKGISEALQRAHYTGPQQKPCGSTMEEARRRNEEARARLRLEGERVAA